MRQVLTEHAEDRRRLLDAVLLRTADHFMNRTQRSSSRVYPNGGPAWRAQDVVWKISFAVASEASYTRGIFTSAGLTV